MTTTIMISTRVKARLAADVKEEERMMVGDGRITGLDCKGITARGLRTKAGLKSVPERTNEESAESKDHGGGYEGGKEGCPDFQRTFWARMSRNGIGVIFGRVGPADFC